MTLLLTLLVKSLLVFAAAGLLLLTLRRSSAAARHLVCLLTLGAVLLLPLCSLSLPGWHLPVLTVRQNMKEPTPHQEPTPPRPSATLPKREGEESGQETHQASSPVSAASYSESSHFGRTPAKQGGGFLTQGGGFFLYLLGLLLASARPLLGLWGIRRLSRHCADITDTPTRTTAADCAQTLGLQAPRLCRADVPVPMTWGWRHPVIVLPLASEGWPEARLRSVLLHEMAHVKRRDWPGHRLADFTCAVLWFHPLVWLTARRLRSESELACDDLVLASGVPAPDYARHLLVIASALPDAPRRSPTAIAMAQTSQIESRLHMILDKTRPRRTVARRVLIFALIPGTAALVTLAVLRPDAKAQTASTAPSLPEPQITYFHLSDQKKRLRLAQAHQLREHLTAWAVENKATILQMQQAQPNDLAALMPVYHSLEQQPLPLWNDDPRVGKSSADPGFSVQTTQLTLAHLQHSQESTCKRIRQEFADFRDFRVSQSIDPGAVSIVVWASGRVTESTLSFSFAGHGKPFLEVESQKVMMPPFFSSGHDARIGGQIRYSTSQ